MSMHAKSLQESNILVSTAIAMVWVICAPHAKSNEEKGMEFWFIIMLHIIIIGKKRCVGWLIPDQ